jgi:hypothetical protein
MKEGKTSECMRVKRDRMRGESRKRDCIKEWYIKGVYEGEKGSNEEGK